MDLLPNRTADALAWLLMREPGALDSEEEQLLRVLRSDPTVETAHGLARSYVAMIQERKVDELDSWLGSCSASEIDGFGTFTASLRQDYAAVRAALVKPWIGGQAEGQTVRLKLLKRQMYGRAGFDLLRKRVLYGP